MEKMPPFEPAKRPEQAHQETELERELIEALKKGESNPEAQRLMREWSEMRERGVA
ncbi:MAG: hypothetical protein HY536_01880 [Candidatus Colwellbacteria bacterium]|nr:hypothetical protein [Candidatus Colwellbacteria bacterium]